MSSISANVIVIRSHYAKSHDVIMSYLVESNTCGNFNCNQRWCLFSHQYGDGYEELKSRKVPLQNIDHVDQREDEDFRMVILMLALHK